MNEPPRVYPPDEAAQRLGLTVARLKALLKETGLPYVNFAEGRPFERNSWGLTAEQIRAVVDARTRAIRPEASPAERQPLVSLARFGHDGVSRLRRRGARG